MNAHGPGDIADLHFTEVDTFPSFEEIEHGQLFALSLSNNTTSYTHGLHRFPAKFIPQVPGWALDNFASRETTVLDPFMGSGTTLVEGLLRGGTYYGVDIDPLARLIASAKTTPIEDGTITRLGEELSARWTSSARELKVPMAGVDNFEHWFRLDQWGWVQSLQETILGLDCNDDEQKFLLAVLSSILRWVSNADDQSHKTYVSKTLPKTPPLVSDVFWRLFHRSADGLADLNRKRHDEAIAIIPTNGNATALPIESSTIGLAIASPPYLDSVDYMYNMMLEYFWLGPLLGVPDRSTFNRMRRECLGAKNPANQSSLPKSLEDLIRLDTMPPARQAATARYFELMDRHFEEVARCLKMGSRYVFVIGNSQTLTNVVPLHKALVKQAESAGLMLERGFGYRIRRHYMKFPRVGRGGIILIDWVLIFRKQENKLASLPLPQPWVTLAPRTVAH